MELRSEEGLNIHVLLVVFLTMSSIHILYNDGNRCVSYVITVVTCTQAHTHTLTHIYPLGNKKIIYTELLGNGDQFTNCMQDVKQGSHPLFSTKFHHKALCVVMLLFKHENRAGGMKFLSLKKDVVITGQNRQPGF